MIRTLIHKSLFALLALSCLTFALPPSIIGLDTTTGTNTSKVLVETSPNVYKSISLYTLRKSYMGSAVKDTANLIRSLFRSTAILDSGLTGYASPPTDTLRLAADSLNVCAYQVAGLSGTSNATGFTIGHIPAAYRPSHTVVVPVISVTDNGNIHAGKLSIATTGIGTVSFIDSVGKVNGTFVGAGTKALGAGASFCYPRF